MNINVAAPQLVRCGAVIALHCSGANAGEWRSLSEALVGQYAVLAPEHYGSESSGPWTGEHAFTLADEAARSVALIDACEEKVHLVGHSYGGGVALHVALARPGRIASLSLYEPTPFHLLRQMGNGGAEADAEIRDVARRIGQSIVIGDYRAGVADFVDYWNGDGAWKTMRPAVQKALICWAPKAPLDFRALTDESTPTAAYAALVVPVLIMRGEHAPLPTRVISERLIEILPNARMEIIAGAGHMGPFTNESDVSWLVARHIAMAESRK